MGWFDKFNGADAHDQVNNSPHKGEFSHELLAAAASYEAAKAYENHVAANGKPDSHAEAKKFLIAAAGGIIDHLVETKGLDFIDKEKAKHQAKEHINDNFTETTYVEEVN